MLINETFIRACEKGDYNTVHQIFQNKSDFTIDVRNQFGRTAMQLAIEKGHIEVG